MTSIAGPAPDAPTLRRTVGWVALLNLAYFLIEIGVALAIGSVSLVADSVDFLEDLAVNTLIFIAMGWPLARRATAGKAMALIILSPAVAALWQAVMKFRHPDAPDPLSLLVTAGGAVMVNSTCALLLSRQRRQGGSLTRAAWLAARNDVIVNLTIIVMAVVTWRVVPNGWPDLILGLLILLLNLTAAKEVWEVAEEERLAARALAGEAGCSCRRGTTPPDPLSADGRRG
ncbi:cation transporter [Arachnia propionica]|uniref:Cation transporter n=1 Tax=Arachnia propionica TaxID=1750 RepID=A0A3P1TCZ5_9ACTN|nr:cation transporter [Arachnia propionica]RRD07317.1 cation transporter [Arachnia propionica]